MTVEKAPLIVPEQWILIYLFMFGGGIAAFHGLDADWKWGEALYAMVTGAMFVCALFWCAVRGAKGRPFFALMGVQAMWGIAGVAAAGLQFIIHEPPQLTAGTTQAISGQIIKVDGRMDQRSRLWLRLDRNMSTRHGGHLPVGSLVRVTTDKWDDQGQIGSHLTNRARLYPPPRRFIAGTADFSLAARVNNVSASGFIIDAPIIREILSGDRPPPTDVWLELARFRAGLVKRVVEAMPPPSGAIAAALLFSERRYVSAETYTQFQRSGMAHLLAISGLHMGLMCFGTAVLVRLVGALFPRLSVQFPLHKFAAVVALIVGLVYVVLAGGAISAIRAYAMASLVVLAVLTDRIALTIRNVALAAIAILTVNPLALFSASFQLSFAATTILVMWYEGAARRKRYREMARPNALVRYVMALVMTALLAALATAPFTAKHFGLVTPWGVIANIFGVPLTGLWVMPAGMVLALGMLFGIEGVVAPVMQGGLRLLVELAMYFAELPFAGWRIRPPGYTAIGLMVSGLVAMRALRRPHNRVGMVLLSLGALVWGQRAQPDGVMLGARRDAALVLVHTPVNALAYAPLSDFARSLVALRLGRAVIDADRALCSDYCRHKMPDGRIAGVLLAPSGIAAACTDASSDFILATILWRQQCRTGKSIYNIGLEKSENYIVFMNESGPIDLVNNSGSSQQVCPEPQPHHC